MSDDERTQNPDTPSYDDPAGGWGSMKGIARLVGMERPSPGLVQTLLRMNKPEGHMCTACAWAKPADPHSVEFCESGAKATVWDLTEDRCTPAFFEQHPVSELLGWSDRDLEAVGRLSHPLRYDADSDRYRPVSWASAFDEIATELRALDPESVVFYTSGRAALEVSYLFSLFARVYGHNNLPDSSNMCHETTSVGLKQVIGSSVGTCTLDDFEHCDLVLFFGQNTGTNSPRLLNPLHKAVKRGCKVATFNPVREQGLIEFADPKNPLHMATNSGTRISDVYLQVKPGGDLAALTGLCKHVLEIEAVDGGVLDRPFIDEHTDRFDELEQHLLGTTWTAIEQASGLSRGNLEEVARLYVGASNVIAFYGMGLTQHVHGSLNIAMLVNLLMLRGNIGRPGAGISPVRGHSNVQGQRTVGISEKPALVPLDTLASMFEFEPPRHTGRNATETVEGLLDGSVKGFVGLGGNFARAIPDQGRVDPTWASLSLNVQIATKLNRSHLLTGRATWLLPCLVRAEEDRQESGPQCVTMEDSLSHIHGSIGKRTPASDQLKSELAIVAGLAEATLPANRTRDWQGWTADYARVRDLIERTYPDDFARFDERKFTPGGFFRGNAARERQWQTDTGRAHFTSPDRLSALDRPLANGDYTLITLRSHDQFNTTVYGFSDRLRGLEGSRDIVLINPDEIARAGLSEGQRVTLHGASDDGHERCVSGLRLVAYDLPDGCVGAYYPETNALIPIGLHDRVSKTPAYKGTPVRIAAEG